jgi:hypothetical protein
MMENAVDESRPDAAGANDKHTERRESNTAG